MARIRVEIDFQLDVEIWLRLDCVARSIRFTSNHLDVELRLPPFSDVDLSSITLGRMDFDGYAGRTSAQVGDPSSTCLTINRFRVTIREDIEGISQADLGGSRASECQMLISRNQREHIKSAEHLAIAFLDRLRVRGQTWLGPMGRISWSIPPHATTYEEDTNYRFLLTSVTVVVPASLKSAMLDHVSFESLTDPLAKSEALPLAESFLADADHFLGRGTQGDLQRAVLIAAMGCELKVKETLRTKVLPGGLADVEARILNPRKFSMSTAGLFDKAMKPAVGRSLKNDDRDLYKAAENLFQKRNRVAHGGLVIKPKDAEQSVNDARKLFAWLDSLPKCAFSQ